jgi:hypothetical protein
MASRHLKTSEGVEHPDGEKLSYADSVAAEAVNVRRGKRPTQKIFASAPVKERYQ